jgi:hypothetical protein
MQVEAKMNGIMLAPIFARARGTAAIQAAICM